jgi:LacI family transcriptional regulator
MTAAMRDVTITDVAQAAGVSLRTVSRVINDSPKVNQETRAKIAEVIARLGFTPSARARALATRKSFLVGLIYDDPNALVLDEVQRGMVEVCGPLGFEVVIHPCHYDAPDLLDDIVAFVRRSRVDGAIVIPPISERPEINDALHGLKAPGVFITSVPAVNGDMLISRERDAARLITQHLLDLGHRRFGFISGPRQFLSAQERKVGFDQAIEAHGGCVVVEAEGDYSFASGLACAEQLLGAADRPTAIFASNDSMAAGVLKVATRLNLGVPTDLSVAGFDDSNIASMLTPSLTTIRRPMRSMAREAMRHLLDRIEHPPIAAAPIVLGSPDLSLIVRESTSVVRA